MDEESWNELLASVGATAEEAFGAQKCEIWTSLHVWVTYKGVFVVKMCSATFLLTHLGFKQLRHVEALSGEMQI